MGYKVKHEEPCLDCGTPTRSRLELSRVPCCLDCAVARSVAHMVKLKRDAIIQRGRDRLEYERQLANRAAR